MHAELQYARPFALVAAIFSGSMLTSAQDAPKPKADPPAATAPALPAPSAPQDDGVAADEGLDEGDANPELLRDALEDFFGAEPEVPGAAPGRALDGWGAFPGFKPFALHFDPRSFALGQGGAMNFQSTTIENGVEKRIHVDVGADGKARATITTTEANGDKSERELEADSVDALRSQAPELESALSGLSFGASSMPRADLFRGSPFAAPPSNQGRPRGLRRLPLRPDTAPPAIGDPASGPRLGVQIKVIEADDPLRAHVKLDPNVGLLVESVVPGSLAKRLGIERFDIVTKIGATPIGEPADVLLALKEADDGLVEVHVLRAGKPLLLTHEPDKQDA